MGGLRMALILVQNFFRNRGDLALENLALRRQLPVFHARKKRPRIRQLDRIVEAMKWSRANGAQR